MFIRDLTFLRATRGPGHGIPHSREIVFEREREAVQSSTLQAEDCEVQCPSQVFWFLLIGSHCSPGCSETGRLTCFFNIPMCAYRQSAVKITGTLGLMICSLFGLVFSNEIANI